MANDCALASPIKLGIDRELDVAILPVGIEVSVGAGLCREAYVLGLPVDGVAPLVGAVDEESSWNMESLQVMSGSSVFAFFGSFWRLLQTKRIGFN